MMAPSNTSLLDMSILLQQHQDHHEWPLPGLSETVQRREYTMEGCHPGRVG